MDELKEKNGPEVTGEEAPVLDVPEGSGSAAPGGGGGSGESDGAGGGGAAEPSVSISVELDPEIEKADDEKAVSEEPAEPVKVAASKKSAKLKVVLLEGKDLDLDAKVYLYEHSTETHSMV